MYILIVEDENHLAQHVQRSLMAEGYASTSLADFDSLETYMFTQNVVEPDLIVLDRMLGSKDSAEKIPQMRAQWQDCKIIVLSAIGGGKDRARLLEMGADDYMNKPFETNELLARIKVLLRRRQTESPLNVSTTCDLCIDESLQDALVSGRRLFLNHKEFLLARMFVQHPNKVFNRFKLLDLVWDVQADVESNVVEATVSYLRRKLEKAQAKCKIQSRRNQGYWLEI